MISTDRPSIGASLVSFVFLFCFLFVCVCFFKQKIYVLINIFRNEAFLLA